MKLQPIPHPSSKSSECKMHWSRQLHYKDLIFINCRIIPIENKICYLFNTFMYEAYKKLEKIKNSLPNINIVTYTYIVK